MVCQIDLAFRFGKPFCRDLDLSKWFAKSIWHLDLANYVAGPRFAKTVWQTCLANHLGKSRSSKMVCQIDLAFTFANWFGKPFCGT
jgi:hypothetical protein